MLPSPFLRLAPGGLRLQFLSQLAVDLVDLLDPLPSVEVLQLQDVPQGPVKVVGDERYLLLELCQGVAGDSPNGLGSTSTSKYVEQDGHRAGMRL